MHYRALFARLLDTQGSNEMEETMSDQPQQPGDAAPSASGEGVPSTGESTSAEDATTAEPHAGDVKAQQPASRGDDSQAPLFAAEEGDRLRGEWEAVQAAFVDDPRAAVQRAGALVSKWSRT